MDTQGGRRSSSSDFRSSELKLNEALGIPRPAGRTTLLRALQVLRDLVPVNDVPPRFQVVRAAVLIVEVVRVLPDVDAEDRRLPIHERAVLVGGTQDLELALRSDEPGPAR